MMNLNRRGFLKQVEGAATITYEPCGLTSMRNHNREVCAMKNETPDSMSRRTLGGLIAGGSVGLLSLKQSAHARGEKTDAFVNGGTVADHLAIEQLLYRYGMGIDDLDAPALADCFAPGAVLWGNGFDRDNKPTEFKLQDSIAEGLVEGHRRLEFTMHTMLNHLYKVEDRRATGTTYGVFTWIVKKEGELKKVDGYARYHDELIRQGDRWRFLKRRFEFIFNTEIPVQASALTPRNA